MSARTRQQARNATASKGPAVESKATPLTEPKKKASAPAANPKKPAAPAKKQDDSPTAEFNENNQSSDVLDFTVSHGTSSIKCNVRPSKPSANSPTMIFTHGAGGDISTPAVSNFADGVASALKSHSAQSAKPNATNPSSIVCFTGSTNLKSRTAMFRAVIDDCALSERFNGGSAKATVLGGRSMGARAAVIASNEMTTESSESQVKKLVLVSYPLLGGNGQVRDEILLEIDESVDVLFMSGDRDNMCDLEALDDVRKRMKAKSWVVAVEGADHGMNCRQKKRTREMQLVTGRIAAEWAMGVELKDEDGDAGRMEGCRMVISYPLAKDGEDAAGAGTATKSNGGKRKRQGRPQDEKGDTSIAKKRKR